MQLTNEDRNWIVAELAKLAASIERVETSVERVETSLLTEFHKWASPVEQRIRSHREALRALDLDLEHVSNRVTKLEPKH